MELQTRQFGMIQVAEGEILSVPRGLLGFEGFERFVLIDSPDCRPFRWLQSVDAPDLSFVVVNPTVFFPEYRVTVHAKEVADINVAQPQDVEIFVIVTVPEHWEEMSANLQGPILINRRNNKVKQLVLTDSSYGVQHSIARQLERTRVEVASGNAIVTIS